MAKFDTTPEAMEAFTQEIQLEQTVEEIIQNATLEGQINILERILQAFENLALAPQDFVDKKHYFDTRYIAAFRDGMQFSMKMLDQQIKLMQGYKNHDSNNPQRSN